MPIVTVQKKIKTYRKIYRFLIIFIGIFAILMFVDIYAVIGVIVGAIFLVSTHVRFKSMEASFKDRYINDYLKEQYPKFIYQASHGIRRDLVLGSRLFDSGNTFDSRNLIEGYIDGLSVQSAFVHLENSGNESNSTVFKGRFFQIELKTPIHQFLYILKRQDYIFKKVHPDQQKIEVESIVFNKTFKIFTSYPKFAFQILKPKITESILEMRKQHGGIRLAYTSRWLYVAIDDENENFSINLFNPIDASLLQQIDHEIAFVRQLIQTLVQ